MNAAWRSCGNVTPTLVSSWVWCAGVFPTFIHSAMKRLNTATPSHVRGSKLSFELQLHYYFMRRWGWHKVIKISLISVSVKWIKTSCRAFGWFDISRNLLPAVSLSSWNWTVRLSHAPLCLFFLQWRNTLHLWTPHLSPAVILWICIGEISCQTPSGSELSKTLRRCQVENLWPGIQRRGTISPSLFVRFVHVHLPWGG